MIEHCYVAQALVMDHLPDVADLARCAGVAVSWRDTVRSGVWPRARRLELRNYGDGTPAAIDWTARRCRNLTEVERGLSHLCSSMLR